MLSASVISQGVRSVAAMLSPEKNPCRVRLSSDCSSSSTSKASNWYRFDPYVSKVLASPMKTQISPKAKSAPAPADEGLVRNSLFAAPVAVAQPTPVGTAVPQQTFATAAAQPAFTASTTTMQSAPQQPAKTHYAIIQFKHDSATYLAPFRVKEGDHVIVEGDRGFDLGVITEITTETPTYKVPLKISRRATSKDMEAFRQKEQKEQIVRQQVQTLADSLSLNIQVVDTEFQFDNNKLTVYFNNAHRGQIDFRKLQRGLFREHRCRIWLSNMAEVEYNAKLQKTRRTR